MREYHVDMERSVIAELENIRLQLEPMEQVKIYFYSSSYACSSYVPYMLNRVTFVPNYSLIQILIIPT